jgi:predicted nuclease with TOPRIM domain
MDKIKEVAFHILIYFGISDMGLNKAIKKKLEKLRIEADTHLARAEKAESQVKDLENSVTKLETENHNLGNKVTLLQGDVERAEKRVEEVHII